MDADRDGSIDSSAHDLGLDDLRGETLAWLAGVILLVVVGVLVATADQTDPPRQLKWIVLLPLLAAAGASRWRPFGLTGASIAVVGCLAVSIVAGVAVFPTQQFIYTFALLVFVAGTLLGDRAAVTACVLASAFSAVWLSHQATPDGVAVTPTVLLLIWLAAVLSWLCGRPTRTSLAWAWSSYLLAQQRTEELREHRGELGRVAKSLTETCLQLEEMNRELVRARRAAEEARRLKTEFAATVSHELRTPLNLVIGFSEMMLRDPDALAGDDLPARYQSALTAVHRNASHISRLIDDILDLSQIEAHRMALTKTWASLASIVDDAVGTITSLYDHVGLTLAVEVADDLPPLYVDPNRIRQVLINLLSNAARFTDRGGVTVRAVRDGHDVRVSVIDTGDGIAAEDLPYVFQEFRQVGPPGRRHGGSGLGLAVCKAFVEMHGGSIWVESGAPPGTGQGSTFSLTLPISTNVVTAPAALSPSPAPGDGRTVIVVDRDPEAVRPFQRYLDGYRVEWAAGAGDLVSLASRHPVHAVLSADETILGQPLIGPLQNVPVFTYALSTPRTVAEALGSSEFLVKPVSHDRLRAAIRRWGRGARDILIVEDDAEMADLLGSMVRSISRRYRARQASDGQTALAMIREQRPDLILLDLLMPTLSGYGVIEAIKGDPALRDIPIVVVSAKTASDEAARTGALLLRRADGLSVGELMLCLRSDLDALLGGGRAGTEPARLAGSPG